MQMKDSVMGVADTCGSDHDESERYGDRAQTGMAKRYSFDGHTPSSTCPMAQSQEVVGRMNDTVARYYHHQWTMN